MRTIGIVLAILMLAGASSTQAPVDGPPWADRLPATGTATPTDRAGPRIAAARETAAAGRGPDAIRQLEVLHTRFPADPAVVEALIDLTDGERQAEWAHRHASLRTTSRGAYRPSGAVRRRLGNDDPHPAAIARARAAAADEVTRWLRRTAKNHASARLLARWTSALVARLTTDAPALAAEFGDVLNPMAAPGLDHVDPVVKPMMRVTAKAASSGDLDFAIRTALTLRGLAAQAALPALVGPRPPPLKRAARAARRVDELRERVVSNESAWTTIAALEGMTPEERVQFSARHASPGNPAVCWSRSRRFRIETTCGAETLLLAARTIEYHHARLVRWFGEDPFEKEVGLVRIVPEYEHLESEGLHYWWAWGFQRAHQTVLRVAWATPAALGRSLTHELTHRFDQHFTPRMPAWLCEGRAVWTSHAFQRTTAKRFATIHAHPDPIDRAYRRYFGYEEELTTLIEGELADPRDNYSAGYALFVYLRFHTKNGRAVFADALDRYMRSFGKRVPPLRRFTRYFCDGKDGRPRGLRGFANRFGEWLSGFHWFDRKPWTKRFDTIQPAWEGDIVFDPATWSRRPRRAEPLFGEGHARTAARLLREAEDVAGAAEAARWALEVDNWTAETARETVELLRRVGDDTGAWVVQALAAERFDATPAVPPRPAPFLPKLPALERLRVALLDAASAYRARGFDRLAATLTRERTALDGFLGLGARTRKPVPAGSVRALPHAIGGYGFTESGLTHYEEHRVRGLWFEEAAGLHVGRADPASRAQTRTAERAARNKHAFVRSARWYAAGRRVIEATITPTTSYVSGAIVLGYRRRDHHVRVQFQMGDFEYAVGKVEKRNDSHTFSSADVWVSEENERSDALGSLVPYEKLRFATARTSVAVKIVIDRDAIHVWFDGQPVGTYRTVDGHAIEGAIGFAVAYGALLVRDATVRETSAADAPLLDPPGLAPVAGGRAIESIGTLRNRTTAGFPRHPHGTLVLWLPTRPPQRGDDPVQVMDTRLFAMRSSRDRLKTLSRYLSATDERPAIVIAVPDCVDDARIATIRRRLGEGPGSGVVKHDWVHAVDRSTEPPTWPDTRLLYIDADGVLRVVASFGSHAGVPWRIRRWLRFGAVRAGAARAAK